MIPHCRLEWGRRGARLAAERGDVVVIVDTLSFSTTTAVASDQGARIYPCMSKQETKTLALHHEAHFAVGRAEVPQKGKYSLSPLTFKNIEPGTRVVLYSLNGGSCCEAACRSKHVLLGSLVNAAATAEAAYKLASAAEKNISVIACGEQVVRPLHDDDFRPAIEDLLGAGAVITGIEGTKTPEALVCEGAFRHHRRGLSSLLWASESGVELRASGFGDDVKFAARLNLTDAVPVLREGFFEKG